MFEFIILALLMLLGMSVCLSADNLLVSYLGLELQSFCVIILLFIEAETYAEVHAGIVYFLSVLMSSVFLLFGISYLYYRFGSVTLSDLGLNIHAFELYSFGFHYADLTISFFLLIGLFVKVGLFPAHLWIPEVYTHGKIFPVSFIATISKLFGFVILMHFVGIFAMQAELFTFISCVSICALPNGAMAALTQTRILSLLGYSAIAHIGYICFVLSLNTFDAFAYAFIYLVIYLFNMIPVFLFLMTARRGGSWTPPGSDRFTYISDFTNVRCRNLEEAVTMSFMSTFFFSLAGLPPFSGFFAKYYLIALLLHVHSPAGAVFVLCLSVISAFYHLKIIKAMLSDSPKIHEVEPSRGFWYVPMNTKIVILIFGVLNICAIFSVPSLMGLVYSIF
jgi:NADH-quinone oxidoreductase subunit N